VRRSMPTEFTYKRIHERNQVSAPKQAIEEF